MSRLISVAFGSRELRVEQSSEARVRSCLEEFQKSGAFRDADNLRRAAFPSSQLYGSQLIGKDRWRIELLYDNLIHEGEGKTEAAALVDAIQRISKVIQVDQESAKDNDQAPPPELRRRGRD